MLSKISNKLGQSINIERGDDYRVTAVKDDASSQNVLLTIKYSNGGTGYLEKVIEGTEQSPKRCIGYVFGSDAGTTCLLSVSQIAPGSTPSSQNKVSYDYDAFSGYPVFNGKPHLVSIIVPNPTGSGDSIQQINYNTTTGKVSSVSDANQVKRTYTYLTDATKIEINKNNDPVDAWLIYHFEQVPFMLSECYRTTGIEDSTGTIAFEYGNFAYPTRTTKITDKGGKISTFTYDVFGNLASIKNSRGTTTIYGRDYEAFPLGRLKDVSVSNMVNRHHTTFVKYDYYSNGLLEKTTVPKPGTTDGSTVFTQYTYDSLGNILTVDSPGNNATTRMITTFNYTTDGNYSQSARIGQPLTVTDNLGHANHFRYDDFGRVVKVWDELGNETSRNHEFIYNLAGQLLMGILPGTP